MVMGRLISTPADKAAKAGAGLHAIAQQTGHTSMKVLVKGVVTREEAELCVEYGADGVYVSNHGGRGVNMIRGSIDALPEVVEGVEQPAVEPAPVFVERLDADPANVAIWQKSKTLNNHRYMLGFIVLVPVSTSRPNTSWPCESAPA